MSRKREPGLPVPPPSEIAGALVLATALAVTATIAVTLFIDSGGDLSAPVELGGRWGNGTVGGAVLALGVTMLLLAASLAFSTWSLLRRFPRRRKTDPRGDADC